MSPEEIAKAALGIEWEDTESAARRVAEKASEIIAGMEKKKTPAEIFTEKFPPGTPVKYFPIKGSPACDLCEIRSEAWETASGEVIVKVTGKAGGVSIKHIKGDQP